MSMKEYWIAGQPNEEAFGDEVTLSSSRNSSHYSSVMVYSIVRVDSMLESILKTTPSQGSTILTVKVSRAC